MAIWLGLALSGCSTLTPQQNFAQHMADKVGRNIDDSPAKSGINAERLVSSHALPDGNLENEYLYHGTCHYFLEIDSRTHNVVGWRSTGNERDCAISP